MAGGPWHYYYKLSDSEGGRVKGPHTTIYSQLFFLSTARCGALAAEPAIDKYAGYGSVFYFPDSVYGKLFDMLLEKHKYERATHTGAIDCDKKLVFISSNLPGQTEGCLLLNVCKVLI